MEGAVNAISEAKPTLFILSGLPGVGKTTLAKHLAGEIRAVYLCIDSIETALEISSLNIKSAQDAGYLAAYQLARDNLQLGMSVVADSVNPIAATRQAWVDVVQTSHAQAIEIEVTCSNLAEHRERVESRIADLPGHLLPTWEEVQSREYTPRTDKRIILDTADNTIEHCYDELKQQIAAFPR